MKKRLGLVVAVVCFLLLTQVAVYAGSAPDGFAGVPWGASSEQVISLMRQQGCNNIQTTTSGISCDGNLAGQAGKLNFNFLNNSFYNGFFTVMVGGPDQINNIYQRFVSLVTQKYGEGTSLPRTNEVEFYIHWNLQDPGAGDQVMIEVGKQIYEPRWNSNFHIYYINKSLQQRLAGQNKNGL